MKNIFDLYKGVIGADKLFGRSADNVQISGQAAPDLIRNKILEGKPLMIARFGATELNCILNYYFINRGLLGNLKNLASGIPYFLKLKEGVLRNMNVYSGFFPPTTSNIARYCELSIADLPDIDILGSWMTHEKFLYPMMNPNHQRVRLGDLTPVKYPDQPWTTALEGKRVLIVQPFEETIKMQYLKRDLLFKNKALLPNFDLITLKAVQSVAGNGYDTGFKDWFEALEHMKEQINKIEFDIAILGCGAYGMPLAAHIKRLGKQAFHLGGETQIMFGIKGKRWDGDPYNYDKLFYNEHWVRPMDIDTPKNINKVEDGCYW
ncbi:hypothetical protein [Pedobacter duraquae]|uniref:Uncharacterized protein n=1 Tax=Pedobacter duraquae TaxID=425511 RepID=A0A4R6IAU3_9SPHI|nr:hypothetical protein [Pedobacter duraquae]TDO19022.1 hypothetical protein CLV32_4644 [Pedobacter duraquae]